MVSKNTTVRSIRLPNETWEWLSGEAEKRGTTVNGLVAEGVALMRAPPVAVKPVTYADYEAEHAKPALKRQGVAFKADVAKFVGKTALGEPLPKPKPFNPQPKKGKK